MLRQFGSEMTKASMKIKGNLLFHRNLGNSCSRRLPELSRGRGKGPSGLNPSSLAGKRTTWAAPRQKVPQRLAYFVVRASLTSGVAQTQVLTREEGWLWREAGALGQSGCKKVGGAGGKKENVKPCKFLLWTQNSNSHNRGFLMPMPGT